MGTMGLGVWMVRGRSRVPLPPARRIAFMADPPCYTLDDRMRHSDEPAEHADAGADVPRTDPRGRAVDGVRRTTDPRCAQGARRRGDLRARLDHRLARRLP